ncbi:MAG: hypothetical protein ACRC0S_01995 [Fusobacteriaceae bacterium]
MTGGNNLIVDNREVPQIEILKQLYILLNTVRGEVPLFRDFGLDGRMVDKPITIIQNSLFIDLENQIKKYIPGLKLLNIQVENTDHNLNIKCEVEIYE